MVNAGTKLSSFFLGKIWQPARSLSPSIRSANKKGNLNYGPLADRHDGGYKYGDSEGNHNPIENGRKIMVVVDPTVESKRALQWAISHAVQTQDNVILLHVSRSPKQASRANELVNTFKTMCRLSRPEVREHSPESLTAAYDMPSLLVQMQVEVAVMEGKEKGPLIVEEARKQGVAVLVLGQKKRSVMVRLVMPRRTSSTVDYCIQNADCMAIAVRRKSGRHGGYLVTTKRHRDFWLLA